MSNIPWQDIDSVSAFTKRNTTMRNILTKEIIQYYSANTKLTMVQKANYGGTTYYRTASARDKDLDWGFEATAFGLPNEAAPSAPSRPSRRPTSSEVNTLPQAEKQKNTQKVEPSNDGEKTTPPFSNKIIGRLRRLFRR